MDLLKPERIRNYRRVTKSLGLWPYQSKTYKRIACVAFLLLTLSLIFPLAAGLTEKWSTKHLIIAKNIASTVFLICGIVQYSLLFAKNKKVRELYELFMSNMEIITDEEEARIMNSYINKGLHLNYLTLSYGFAASGVAAVFAPISPLQEDNSEEDYKKYFPYYYSGMVMNESYRYILAFLHVSCIFVLVAFSYSITSITYITCVCHFCGVYGIARYRLENLMNICDDLPKKIYKLKDFEHEIKIISNIIVVIKKHKEALHELDLIKNVFAHSIFTLQLSGYVIISILIYDTLYDNDIYMKVAIIALASTTFLYTFSINWAGEQILITSNDFFMATYLIRWYELPAKAKKLLIIIRQKSIKIEMMTIGSLWILSFENLRWVAQACWSIATVLLSVQKKVPSNLK